MSTQSVKVRPHTMGVADMVHSKIGSNYVLKIGSDWPVEPEPKASMVRKKGPKLVKADQ